MNYPVFAVTDGSDLPEALVVQAALRARYEAGVLHDLLRFIGDHVDWKGLDGVVPGLVACSGP